MLRCYKGVHAGSLREIILCAQLLKMTQLRACAGNLRHDDADCLHETFRDFLVFVDVQENFCYQLSAC